MAIRIVGEGAAAREACRLLALAGGSAEGLLLDTEDPDLARAALHEARGRRVLISSLAVERAPGLPANRPAAAVRKTVEESGRPCTILLPAFLYQDDLAFRDSIFERGLYPLPLGSRGMSRVDARDVAEAAVRALLEPGHEGRAYPLVGPEALTVDDVIGIYRYALGRELRASDGESALVDRYRAFSRTGLSARCGDFALMDRLLRRPPRPFGLFARETAEAWSPRPA